MTKLHKNNVACLLAIIICTILTICIVFTNGYSMTAYADTSSTTYSNVIEDLKKDSSFNTAKYPQKANDYSLQVIRVAESVDNELFVYVYQPSGEYKDLRASSINISRSKNENGSEIFKNYKLRYINSLGVFYKYVVNDFIVESNKESRYYYITSIYRIFDETLGDKQASGDNTITEVNFEVSKKYGFTTTEDNDVTCSEVTLDSILVTSKFVGYCRYDNGYLSYTSACDSHFVAFDTDIDMDKVFEADVYYSTQSYTYNNYYLTGEKETYGEIKDEYAYLTYTQHVDHTGGGIFAGTYSWDRIETVDQFLSENEKTDNIYSGVILDVSVGNKINDSAKAELKKNKWVLRFTETLYEYTSMGQTGTWRLFTLVGDVSILRLKFEKDGKTYDYGVVDNKQTGSRDPINDEKIKIEFKFGKEIPWWVYLIIGVIALIIIFPFISPFLRILIGIISIPFKMLGKLIKIVIDEVNKNKKE